VPHSWRATGCEGKDRKPEKGTEMMESVRSEERGRNIGGCKGPL